MNSAASKERSPRLGRLRSLWNGARKRLRRWFAPLPLGRQGERAAARFLQRLGYLILARSNRSQLGEIDIVAVDGRTLVFVEVKTRRSRSAGAPEEAVDEDKQRRLTRAALSYRRMHELQDCSARFDVVAVTWPAGERQPTIEHFRNAFEATAEGGPFG